jgi:hypothetical protein
MATTTHVAAKGTSVQGAVRRVSAGELSLPIEYHDGSMLTVVTFVPAAAVQALLPTRRLRPLSVRGKAALLLTAFEYRATSIGPYNELSVAFLVRPDAGPLAATGAWVHRLPVTTEIALAAGKELWGYPKWVTPITWEHRADTLRAGLPGQLAITVRARRWPAPWLPMPLGTYTIHEGRLVFTPLRVNGHLRLARGGAARVEVTGDGEVARALCAVGADRTPPAFALWCDDLSATLPLGRDTGPA